mmetsp:Transcript_5218/g.13051  ORF Transcript_5218/g.13051 Transcript_5218/m.13051 type:complete len:260 (-) Transcript_5218:312-1091(-)
MTLVALFNSAIPASFSNVMVLSTYMGGAISLILMGLCSVPVAMPAKSASRMASIPSYVKQLTSTSARILMGWGASRLRMYILSSSMTSAGTSNAEKGSVSPSLDSPPPPPPPEPVDSSASAILNASYACPYFLYNGHAMRSYRSSNTNLRRSARCLKTPCTALALLNLSSHAATSSGLTRRFDRSIYPLSLSTLRTMTTSFRPTRMSLLMERMRRLLSSLRRMSPSMLLYSRSETYAPMSATVRTFTMTRDSISGYLAS